MPDLSPAETLRAAAVRLRAGSPLVDPLVAEPIAREMEMHATWIDLVRTDPLRHARVIGCAEYMLALARSILEQP